jgi:DNA-directed RNA polymerase subunit RPC12/RpoP
VDVAVRLLIAMAMGYGIYRLGTSALRSASASPTQRGPGELEDPEGGKTFLICGECGTEFEVTKVGQGGVPRHCGEKMRVEHRPAG